MIQLTLETGMCETLAQGFLQRRGAIDWLEWLPLAQVAAEAPLCWAAAFNQLALEQQFSLMDLLRLPAAGPLADSLLILLATYASEIADEQVRQYVLEDAQSAHERHGARLQALQSQLQPLTEQVGRARQRLQNDFDMAREIERLEQALAEMRGQENEQDERFARVHELERELLRLETHRRILAHYDEAERRGYLEQLRAEVTAQKERKAELEQGIAAAIAERDTRQREMDTARQQLDAVGREVGTGLEQATQLHQELARLADELARQRNLEQRLRQEREQLRLQTVQQEQEERELRVRLQAECSRLQQLRETSQRAGMAELEQKVREVYALLPADLADQSFSSR